jgi:nitrile hydratase
MRYLIMPMRPVGTESMTEAELASLITRDSMIGVTTARSPYRDAEAS